MTKVFCDVCGAEIERNWVSERLNTMLGRVRVEVTVAVDGVWNKGAICKACLLKVINEGKEGKP